MPGLPLIQEEKMGYYDEMIKDGKVYYRVEPDGNWYLKEALAKPKGE